MWVWVYLLVMSPAVIWTSLRLIMHTQFHKLYVPTTVDHLPLWVTYLCESPTSVDHEEEVPL